MEWTRAQAQEYLKVDALMQAPTGVDRYISSPAQALSCKMGQLMRQVFGQGLRG